MVRIDFIKSILPRFYLLLATVLFTASAFAASDKPTVTLWNGQQYILEERLGNGSFGFVYSATSVSDQSIVALKFFDERKNYDSEAEARLKNLFRSQAKDYVVKIFSKGVIKDIDGDVPGEVEDAEGVIVMEKVDGTLYDIEDQFAVANSHAEPLNLTESELLKRTRLAHELIYQIINLWAGIASNKLIHGDVKPGNIGYMANPFRIKLLDIGSIRVGPLTRKSKIKLPSTAGYEAPEALQYENDELPSGDYYSSFGDLYSFGVSLLELLCKGCSRDEMEEMLKQWETKLGSSESGKPALARLHFAADFIHAAMRTYPETRYEELQEGPLGKILKFRAPSRDKSKYVQMRPRIVVNSAEEIEQIYLAHRENMPEDVDVEIDVEAEIKANQETGIVPVDAYGQILGPAETKVGFFKGLFQKIFGRFYRKCADILTAIRK